MEKVNSNNWYYLSEEEQETLICASLANIKAAIRNHDIGHCLDRHGTSAREKCLERCQEEILDAGLADPEHPHIRSAFVRRDWCNVEYATILHLVSDAITGNLNNITEWLLLNDYHSNLAIRYRPEDIGCCGYGVAAELLPGKQRPIPCRDVVVVLSRGGGKRFAQGMGLPFFARTAYPVPSESVYAQVTERCIAKNK